MLYVLIGEDDFSIHEALAGIKRGLGDQAALATNTVTFGADVTLDRLRAACETMPFLADKRLVIIEGLFEKFETKAKATPRKRPDEKDEPKLLAACMTHLPEFTTLVLLGGKIGSRNPLLAALSGKAEVKSFPSLRRDDLEQWIARRVSEGNGSMSSAAVALLARVVGGNLWVMANEVDKLLLFTGGRRIEEKDVLEMVSDAQEANVFAMVDAILGFRPELAGQLLQKLLQWGAAPPYLLLMLARQAGLIVRAKDMAALGKSGPEIQQALGLADFAVRRTLEQSGRYSMERLREVYHRLLEADLAIKTGRLDGELALDILVAELCQGSRVGEARAYRR